VSSRRSEELTKVRASVAHCLESPPGEGLPLEVRSPKLESFLLFWCRSLHNISLSTLSQFLRKYCCACDYTCVPVVCVLCVCVALQEQNPLFAIAMEKVRENGVRVIDYAARSLFPSAK
jgi:hypothetical protein